jgi:hypothetical protein
MHEARAFQEVPPTGLAGTNAAHRDSMPAFRTRVLVVALVLLPCLAACNFGGPYNGDFWGSGAYDPSGGTEGGGATDFGIATCALPAVPAAGHVSPGGYCVTAEDCAPVCCGCGGPEWLAASCIDNRCAEPEVACSRTGTCSEGVWVDDQGAGWTDACGGLTYGDEVCDVCMATSCCQAMAACASDAACMGPEPCIATCDDDDCVAACEEASAESPVSQALDACLATSCGGVCR